MTDTISHSSISPHNRHITIQHRIKQYIAYNNHPSQTIRLSQIPPTLKTKHNNKPKPAGLQISLTPPFTPRRLLKIIL